MANVLLPIETKVRELDGKSWLAANIAAEGHRVAIGEKPRMSFIREFQPDFILEVSLTYTDSYYNRLSELNSYGCKIGVLDTEGGVFLSDKHYLENHVSEDILRLVDVVFAWGQAPADIIQKGTFYPPEKIVTSGNPRFDLLNPQLREYYSSDAGEICSTHGEFILVNTNFTRANPYDKQLLRSIRQKRNIDNRDSKFEFQSTLLEHFELAIDEITTHFSETPVVIRPHPSENHDYYRDRFDDNPLVSVRHQGDVRAWIFASNCVIHNGCTTGIEAAMMNKPVISFEPHIDVHEYPRPRLPSVVSRTTETIDDLIDTVRIAMNLDDYSLSADQLTELKQYFTNVHEPAAPKITEHISEITQSNKQYPTTTPLDNIKSIIKQSNLGPILDDFMINSFDQTKHNYRNQKFPGLKREEIVHRLELLSDHITDKSLSVSKINKVEDIFLIQLS